jgi:sialidase-1
VRRSADGGRTWGHQETLYEEGGTRPVTIGNPCPVVDRSTGTVWLTFLRDYTDVVTASTDDGRTWAAPQAITDAVKRPTWGWYATNPTATRPRINALAIIRCPHPRPSPPRHPPVGRARLAGPVARDSGRARRAAGPA